MTHIKYTFIFPEVKNPFQFKSDHLQRSAHHNTNVCDIRAQTLALWFKIWFGKFKQFHFILMVPVDYKKGCTYMSTNSH